jgi:glycerol-3-phosphate dehydrogenase
VRDELSGSVFDVSARLVVNATGPWLDRTTGSLRAAPKPLLRLTKGVHLVTPSFSHYAQVLFADTDGRLFFVVPWLGMSLVGTTDTDFSGDPASVSTLPADVAYLAAEAGRAFPGAPVQEIYYTFAGLRALVRAEGVDEGRVSRKHAIWDHAKRDGVAGIVSVVGGKITAYRGIAEEVGDLASRKLGHVSRSYSARRPLPGGRGLAVSRARRQELSHHAALPPSLPVPDLAERAAGLGLAPDQVKHLASTYGALAHAVLDVVDDAPETAARVAPNGPVILAELVRALDVEWAETLGDVLLRRLPVGLSPTQGLEALEAYTRAVGGLRGWDAATRAEMAAAYRAELAPMRRFSAVIEG